MGSVLALLTQSIQVEQAEREARSNLDGAFGHAGAGHAPVTSNDALEHRHNLTENPNGLKRYRRTSYYWATRTRNFAG